jgi:hypothetical protein
LQIVKSRCVFEHRRIATLLHIGQDVGHALLDGGVGVGRPMQALLKQGFKVGLGGGQAQRTGLHGIFVLGFGTSADGRVKSFYQVPNGGGFELHRGLIYHQARADVHDALNFNQVVGFQGAAS